MTRAGIAPWLLLAGLGLALGSGHAADSADPAADARYRSLISELRCLVCQNQAIAESDAPLAADLREQVRAQIAQGRSDAQIVEFLTDRYGDFVLYRPPFRARTWLLWLGPFAVLALAAIAALIYVRRMRPTPGGDPAEAPPEIADTAERPAAPSFKAYLAAAAVLLGFAAAWYVASGSWRTQALIELAKTDPDAAEREGLDATLERLRAQLEHAPDDADTWFGLARGEMRRERYAAAAQAYGRANELTGEQNPDWLVEEGEALAAVHDLQFGGAAAGRFQAALALAPDHPRALWYAGLAALQAGGAAAAVGYWERLLAQPLPEGLRGPLQQRVAELRASAGLPEPPSAGAGELKLTLEIVLAPELAGSTRETDTLLVYALDPAGSRMPLAVHRRQAPRLPLTVTLSDSDSMVSSRKLSSVGRWRVLARVTSSGQAQPQPGDLQGEVEIAKAQAGRAHRLLIDRRL